MKTANQLPDATKAKVLDDGSVDAKFIEALCNLAMLTLTEEQEPKAVAQILAMKKAFEIINSRELAGVKPLFLPHETAHFRKDAATLWEGAAAALEQVPERQGNLVKVPLVIG